LRRKERKSTLRKRGYDYRIGSRGLGKTWRGRGDHGEGRGNDTGIEDDSGQRLEEGKEAWSSSRANQAGIGGCQACSRSTTASCSPADACQSGM